MKIILVGRVAAGARALLESHLRTPCQLVEVPGGPKAPELPEQLADADVIVGDVLTESMGRSARRLKLFQSLSAGVDHHDLSALPGQAAVANVYGHGPAIGEYVILAILALSRGLNRTQARFRQGYWEGAWIFVDIPRIEELEGKILGILGFGHIGRHVAVRARAFGMRVWALRSAAGGWSEEGLEFCGGPGDLQKLVSAADFLTIACPLNATTRNWIGARELGWLKPTAFLINVARGPIVEEEALYQALEAHRFAGAALDVWYRYPSRPTPFPPSRFPFEKLDNVLMTPHISGWTQGTRRRRFQAIAANIDRLAEGLPLENVIRPPSVGGASLGKGGSMR